MDFEKIERLRAMADKDQATWDLSAADQEAIRWAMAAIGNLSRFTTEELQDELRRRKARPHVPSPAGKCERCGAVWYYQGVFKPSFFEIQAEAFAAAHKSCPITFNGGGI